MLGQKWVLRIIRALGDRTQRFCELQDALGGANSATLSQRLKLLEDEGLIERRAISAVPPWVEYSLTPKGSELRVRDLGHRPLGRSLGRCPRQ